MWLTIILVLNGILGAYMFERAWAATSRHRQVDEARDSLFPAWRNSECLKWNKWSFYPLAVTIMPLRFFCFIASLALIPILHSILLFGHDLNKPIP